jgi:hypothetical protein
MVVKRKEVLKNKGDIINRIRKILNYCRKLVSKIWILWVILLGFFVILEINKPYYFLQDDNRDFYLPYFVNNIRSLSQGELPLINFHQLLGSPLLASGQTGALYFPAYLVVALSKIFTGHVFAAIDMLVILHLIVGASGVYYILKLIGIDGGGRTFGALAWPLAGFIMYSSNSWVVISGAASYFPWMLYFSTRLFEEYSQRCNVYSQKNFICLLAARLSLFYTGHIQYFIYSVIFEGLTVLCLILVSCDSRKNLLRVWKFIQIYIISYIFTLVLSLPLLMPMWHQTEISATRNAPLDFEMYVSERITVSNWLKGLSNPAATTPETDEWAYRRLNNLSHIGFLSIPFFAVGSFTVAIKKFRKYIIAFLFSGLIAFLWQSSISFNEIIYNIPILNRFRWPFKLQFFTSFFMVIIAAAGANIIIHIAKKIDRKAGKAANSNSIKMTDCMGYLSKKKSKSGIACIIILLQMINYVWLYVFNPQVDFGHHLDSVPLEEPLREIIDDGKIVSVGFNIWEPNYKNITGFRYYTSKTLGFNYPTLWGLYAFAGYDPLVSRGNNETCLNMNFDAAYNNYSGKIQWGVRWYIVDNTAVNGYDVFKNSNAYSLEVKYRDDSRTVFMDKKTRSVVYWSDTGNNNGIDYKIKSNAIEINVNNLTDRELGVNFVYNENYILEIDGQKHTPGRGDYGQIVFNVPEGNSKILLRYTEPGFIKGCVVSWVFIAVIITVKIIKHLIKRKRRGYFDNKQAKELPEKTGK